MLQHYCYLIEPYYCPPDSSYTERAFRPPILHPLGLPSKSTERDRDRDRDRDRESTLSEHFGPPYCILWVFLAKVPKSTDLSEISTFRYILLFYLTGDRILRSFIPYAPAIVLPYRTILLPSRFLVH